MLYYLFGVGAFVLSYVGVLLVRRWALRRNLLDVPNERSSHLTPTPRGGGLAVVVVVLIGSAVSMFWTNDLTWVPFAGYWVGALILVTIGIAEDVRHVSPKVRLAIHMLAAIVFMSGAGFVNQIYFPLIGNWDWGLWGILVTLFWMVGLCNAYNFMDGIDGIAASQAIIAGIFWLVMGLAQEESITTILSVLVICASLGFLLHNLPPARIFMGDVGSTFLGFTFAAIPVLMYRATADPRMLILGAFFLAPFVFDTSLTILRRALKRENVLHPHRTHLYQRLVKIGYPHGAVSLLYAFFALATGILGLAYFRQDELSLISCILVIAILLALFGLVSWLEYQHKPKDDHIVFPLSQ